MIPTTSYILFRCTLSTDRSLTATVATSSAKQYSGDAGVTNPTGSTSSGFFKGFAQDKSRRDSFSEDWLLNDFATNLDFLDL